jgi:signal transduction histidine kinase
VYEKVSLTDILEDVLGISRAALERHKIALEVHEEELPPVVTDRHKVLQILLNLMRNAKDAVQASGNPHPHITVRIRRVDQELIAISVSDNGIGIPPANLVRIFSHGFTTKKDGHGFGLHSGALAAKELGGSLTADSTGTDAGATFTLQIPMQAAALERTAS